MQTSNHPTTTTPATTALPEPGTEQYDEMMDFTADFDLSAIDFGEDENAFDLTAVDSAFADPGKAIEQSQRQDSGLKNIMSALFDGEDSPATEKLKNPIVNAEDFEDDGERQALLLIKKHTDILFAHPPSKNAKARLQAIRFLFDPLFVLAHGYDLDLCCRSIHASVRLDVVQLRIQYEFWQQQIVFQNPFPFDTGDLSSMIENNAYSLAQNAGVNGDVGASIAWRTWAQPGVGTGEVIASVLNVHPDLDKKDIFKCLTVLEDEYFISRYYDHCYLTGINPIRQAEFEVTQGMRFRSDARLNWSRRFGRVSASLLF